MRKRKDTTKIQWADLTWNPWKGCTKVSTECANCYMFTDMARFGQDPTMVVRTTPKTFNRPIFVNKRGGVSEAPGWGGAPLVFTCSWSDWFHKDADPWRGDAWAIVAQCDSLIFQVLTKRHGRIAANLPEDWGDGYPNVWLGVSGGTHEEAVRRVRAVAQVPAAVRFLSCEPQLGPLDWDEVLSITDPITGRPALDWVIVGGESGPGARPFRMSWAFDAIQACKRYGVACFVKQLGANAWASVPEGTPRYMQLCESTPLGEPVLERFRTTDRKGGDWDEWPIELRVRQWPGQS